MRASALSVVATCAVAAVTLLACGARTPLGDLGSPSDAGPDPDASETSAPVDAQPLDTAPPETSIPEAAPPDSCQLVVPPEDDAGVCNSLAPSGPLVPIGCDKSPTPTPSGGTIVDGVYVLTSAIFHDGCPFPDDQDRITWAICGDTWATVQQGMSNGSPFLESIDLAAVQSGAMVSLSPTCSSPTTSGATFGYDATPTTITFYVTNVNYNGATRVDTLVRQ